MFSCSWRALRRALALLVAVTTVFTLAQTVGASTMSMAFADASTGAGGEFVPVQGRILDTRAVSSIGGYTTQMPAETWRSVQVAGQVGIPSDGVAAVALNFTALNDAAAGHLNADKDEATPNGTGTYLFWNGGSASTNSGVVAVGTDGKIQVKATTATDLVIDVQGYYTSGSPAAGGFVPLAESRLVDTRNGTGLPAAPLAAGSTTTVKVGGLAGVPADASAVMINVLVINQTASGSVIPYPADQTKPQQKLAFGPADPDSTTSAVALSTTGSPTGALKVNIEMNGSGGTLDLVVDVLGYFTFSESNGAFTPAAARVYDSRNTGNSPLAAGASRTIQVGGVAGVPSSGIGAVAMNVEIFDRSGASGGWTHVWPDDQPEPNPSMAVQYVAGGTASNLLTIAPGADGGVSVHNMGSDSVDIAVDVQGWYSIPDLLDLNVRDVNGEPDAGAQVTVTAWPNASTLDALADGDSVPTATVESGYTGSSGGFSANPDLSSLDPATYDETGGAIQLEVDVVDADGYRQEADFSAAGPTSDDAVEGDAASVTAPETMGVDLQSSQISEGIGTASPPETFNSAASTSGLIAPFDFYCLDWKKTRHIVRDERFYNLYAYGPSQVAEQSGSAHSIAIGVNLAGDGWKLDATVERDTKSSAGGTLPFTNNHTLYNSMNVSRFDRDCYSTSGGSGWHDAKAVAGSFHDLMVSTPHIINRAWNKNNCTLRTRGDWYKTSGRDQKFSAGISTPWINLTARAAYSRNMRVDWYPPSGGEYLCGSNSLGFASAPFAGGYSANTGCGPTGQDVSYDDGSLADLTANGGAVDDYTDPTVAPLC